MDHLIYNSGIPSCKAIKKSGYMEAMPQKQMDGYYTFLASINKAKLMVFLNWLLKCL